MSTSRVAWLDRPPDYDPPLDQLVIAPTGEGAWRHAPFPADDSLFELPAADGRFALLTGGDPGLRDAVARRAAARGVSLEPVHDLDDDALTRASCVVIAETFAGALPARAFSVLAARRLLIVPRVERTFGLEDGLDHVEFADPDEAVTAIEAYRSEPGAFERMLAWGRLKAEPQRASVVQARLAADLRLHGLG